MSKGAISKEQAIKWLSGCIEAGYPASITLNGEEHKIKPKVIKRDFLFKGLDNLYAAWVAEEFTDEWHTADELMQLQEDGRHWDEFKAAIEKVLNDE